MNTQFENLTAKLMNWPEAKEQVRDWRTAGEKVVFTNGCFDILHLGHVSYLAAAADQGDRLVIGLNSQDSVRRLKGEGRPIQDEKTRQYLLAALAFVDAVVVFREDTPLKLIQSLRPDLLVKGGDYRPGEVVGAEVVSAYGGEVKIIPFLEGYSTSSIAEKIKREG